MPWYAGTARAISPPGGAVTTLPEGGTYQRLVIDRANIVARSLRNDRGRAIVRTYVLPKKSPWLQSRRRESRGSADGRAVGRWGRHDFGGPAVQD